MPAFTPALALIIFGVGAVAGVLGALLGIGGGVFLIPFLALALQFPFSSAAAISLTTVIATSSAVSAAHVDHELINLRLGMFLEVATAAGGLLGGVTAPLMPPVLLHKLFGIVVGIVAIALVGRLDRRNVILDPAVDTGRLGGRFYEQESGAVVTYRVKRLPLALVASFVAGNLSSLLGIGGGVIKVPVLNAWCGVPLRAAAATSALMIGVTATGGAIIYYGHNQLSVPLAAAAVLGVQIGSRSGLRLGEHTPVRALKLFMAVVLAAVSMMMFVRGNP